MHDMADMASGGTPITTTDEAPVRSSVLDCIGHTPLVNLSRLARIHGLECNLLAKLEYFNAGGSVKDRIALRMVQEAEREGRLVPGKSVVIEPTSGNTGIGLALACAVKGYKCIITLPEKMSREKVNTLKALGAKIIRTPTSAAFDSPESHISVARRLEKQIPGGVILDQYSNRFNPQAHHDTTAWEIIQSLSRPTTFPSSGVVDLLVCGAGTGGTISGISRRLKSHYSPSSATTVLGVDPHGSVLARPSSLNAHPPSNGHYAVEGIGYDFVPDVLDHSLVDVWTKGSDEEAFATTRQLIRTEGLLVGGSSGQAMSAALSYISKGGEGWERFGSRRGVNVVVVCPDSIRNYVTKEWLEDQDGPGGKGETTEDEVVASWGHHRP